MQSQMYASNPQNRDAYFSQSFFNQRLAGLWNIWLSHTVTKLKSVAFQPWNVWGYDILQLLDVFLYEWDSKHNCFPSILLNLLVNIVVILMMLFRMRMMMVRRMKTVMMQYVVKGRHACWSIAFPGVGTLQAHSSAIPVSKIIIRLYQDNWHCWQNNLSQVRLIFYWSLIIIFTDIKIMISWTVWLGNG